MTAPDPLINIEAEAALLGAMLIDNSLITELAARVTPQHFVEPLHRRIYDAMLRVTAKGASATAIGLKPIFMLDPDADGGAYLDQLVDIPAAVVGAKDFADQIVDFAQRRVARDLLRQSAERVEQDLEAPIGDAIGAVGSLSFDDGAVDSAAVTLGDMLRETAEEQEQFDEGHARAIYSNKMIADLDTVIGEIDDPQLIYLGGRPGMGKTALAMSAGVGWAIAGANVRYKLLEGTKRQASWRLSSMMSMVLFPDRPVRHDTIKRRKMTPNDRMVLARSAERADLLPFKLKELGPCNINRIWAEAARDKALLEAEGKTLDVLIVDYAGLAEADDADGKPIEDDRKRMNAISRRFVQMKKALGCTILVLVQVGRGVEQRANKRPMLSDLKETGNLEQDADQVLFVYRHEEYLAQEEPKPGEKEKGRDAAEEWRIEMESCRGKIELIGAKNRHGPKITRIARFFGAHYCVRDSSVSGSSWDEPLLDLD